MKTEVEILKANDEVEILKANDEASDVRCAELAAQADHRGVPRCASGWR